MHSSFFYDPGDENKIIYIYMFHSSSHMTKKLENGQSYFMHAVACHNSSSLPRCYVLQPILVTHVSCCSFTFPCILSFDVAVDLCASSTTRKKLLRLYCPHHLVLKFDDHLGYQVQMGLFQTTDFVAMQASQK